VTEVNPNKGAVVNVGADGAVVVVVWWNAAGRNKDLDRPSDLFTVDGDRMDWQTIQSLESARVVRTIMNNLAHNPSNGPVTVIGYVADDRGVATA
jgi:hypothetical protein